MKLKDLLKDVEYKVQSEFPRGLDIDIKGVSSDSKTIGKDCLFIAVSGTNFDGHKFANEAADKGASAVVLEKDTALPEGVARIFVRDSRAAAPKIANNFFGRPIEKLTCIGITGTNGKTTISYLMDSIVSAAGHKAGIIGTISYRIGKRLIPATNTTPGPVELYGFMGEMARNGSDHLVMEVSSHALDQNRVGGIDFSAAIFTNLTGDHLDYHKTFDGYFRAKSRLFEGLKDCAYAVINIDDEWGKKLVKVSKGKVVTYGTKLVADYLASDIKLSLDGTRFAVNSPKGDLKVDSKLIGLHNVYNMTAAAACGMSLGFSSGEVKRGLENLTTIPGRLEPVDCGQPFKIFVDYAHTDDALFNVLSALKPLIGKKIIVVFGCGGDRDRTKRPRMGKVASEMADLVIVTSDNPRSEEPEAIIAEITAGISKKNYKAVTDRSKAIEEALSAAREGDCVLIAGKGHETYQVLKNTTVAFDDREIAKKICITQKIS
ncbi:MAG: UDP-N-acetylmuramoyl-L-alanyl-D-glutamate--2,6-diaminopimelate ligase [Candidatus Omnitrophica bacterium]|nr:UDP-N-acetylmuramoyl-L-alanyl-D-glutamate--2,6-diaminopimelate ligase [Candidatus Omnitrophota bacterium]MDD5546710.1 UDP-N-acetylmuramoyl-L-alanyl-D-glutamate--2,6-diaminopimelate ligase [Candidatus Omnitrophota bacterium]